MSVLDGPRPGETRSVLDGPRIETRRVLHEGRAQTAQLEDGQLRLESGAVLPEVGATYLAPTEARTIVCVHLNYRSRAVEFGRALEGEHPTYFLKPAAALNGHQGKLVRPADCKLLNYEGEIAAVVGRTMRNVRAEDVWDHLAGFSCANDVGAHDFRDTDAGSMLRVKGQDGFCPIGPGLVRGVDIRKSVLRTFVNGHKVQEGAVAEMVWGIDVLFADLTRHLTLHAGDVVLTGTPWHSRPMFPGDIVAVEVDGIGRLENRVVSGPAPDNRHGFPATVTKTSLGVALGSDYHALKRPGEPPTPEQYQAARAELIERNMPRGPQPPAARPEGAR
ncbi:MAG TPA: fumarylacetoacetate hydrolase family protein [Polyangiales bacterium]|nr:fumarylacetoacetate hydrolase family protein [Polyangiales bacterium]